MEKIKLNLQKREWIKKSFAGQEIEIKPYIELELLISIVNVIFESTISDKIEENNNEIVSLDVEDKVICLKRFNLAIVDQCSNVDVDNIDTEILLTSGIDDYILKFISNYNIGKEILLNEIIEYNLQSNIIRMFNDVPSIDDMGEQISQISNILENVSEKVLKNVGNSYLQEEAKITTKANNKNNKLKS